MFKIIFQCFELIPLMLLGYTDRSNLHAKAQSPFLLRFEDATFAVTTFWTIFRVLDQNGPELLLPLISPRGYVRSLFNLKGNLQRVQEPSSNRV